MPPIELKQHEARIFDHIKQFKRGRQPPITKEEVLQIKELIGKVPYSKIQIEHAVSDKLITRIKKGDYSGY